MLNSMLDFVKVLGVAVGVGGIVTGILMFTGVIALTFTSQALLLIIPILCIIVGFILTVLSLYSLRSGWGKEPSDLAKFLVIKLKEAYEKNNDDEQLTSHNPNVHFNLDLQFNLAKDRLKNDETYKEHMKAILDMDKLYINKGLVVKYRTSYSYYGPDNYKISKPMGKRKSPPLKQRQSFANSLTAINNSTNKIRNIQQHISANSSIRLGKNDLFYLGDISQELYKEYKNYLYYSGKRVKLNFQKNDNSTGIEMQIYLRNPLKKITDIRAMLSNLKDFISFQLFEKSSDVDITVKNEKVRKNGSQVFLTTIAIPKEKKIDKIDNYTIERLEGKFSKKLFGNQ